MISNETALKQLKLHRTRMQTKRWMILGDLWDIDKAIKLLEEGKSKRAASFIDDWDSDARDELRESLWNWVQGTMYPEEK